MRSAPAPGRLPAIDVARGIALLAMFVYHLTWDLSHFGLIDADLPLSREWKTFAHVIAASFLALVGINLVLARGSADKSTFWKRLARIAAAAAAISLVTYLVLPSAFIFFGILHCIVLSSLLALPLLMAPLLVLLTLALAAFLLPVLLAGSSGGIFDQPAWLWLGLATSVPPSVDYQPILPWFGMVLLGVCLGRLILVRTPRILHRAPTTILGRIVQFGGRHSLLVYLVHQPIFFAVLFAVTQGLGIKPAEPSDEAGFARACESQCQASGGIEAICRKACSCVITELKQAKIWTQALAMQLEVSDRERLNAIAARCSGLQ